VRSRSRCCCKLQDFKNWSLKPLTSHLFLNVSLIVWAPTAWRKRNSPLLTDGRNISGRLLLKKGIDPRARCRKAEIARSGIFRSVLTDLEGHFEVRSLPPARTKSVSMNQAMSQHKQAHSSTASTSPLAVPEFPNTAQTERTGTRFRHGTEDSRQSAMSMQRDWWTW